MILLGVGTVYYMKVEMHDLQVEKIKTMFECISPINYRLSTQSDNHTFNQKPDLELEQIGKRSHSTSQRSQTYNDIPHFGMDQSGGGEELNSFVQNDCGDIGVNYSDDEEDTPLVVKIQISKESKKFN